MHDITSVHNNYSYLNKTFYDHLTSLGISEGGVCMGEGLILSSPHKPSPPPPKVDYNMQEKLFRLLCFSHAKFLPKQKILYQLTHALAGIRVIGYWENQ